MTQDIEMTVLTVCEGDEDEEEGEEGSKAGEGSEAPKVPSLGDYIMHCLSLFWKILFAFVPPTGQTYFLCSWLTFRFCDEKA